MHWQEEKQQIEKLKERRPLSTDCYKLKNEQHGTKLKE